MLVDDQRSVAEAVRRLLAPAPELAVHFCQDPARALEMARGLAPAVILQGLIMPGSDGLYLLDTYRADPVVRDIPAVVLSTREDPLVKAEAFTREANDYLVKLPQGPDLAARMRTHAAADHARRERDVAFQALAESERRRAWAGCAVR